jgi:hypothetical protein
MPFGLKNAAQTFQHLMDKLFPNLPFVYVYLDNILIASKDHTEHMRTSVRFLKFCKAQDFKLTQQNAPSVSPPSPS